MLVKPDLPDVALTSCLSSEFGIEVTSLSFLPLGADADTAVYRAGLVDGSARFVKLRSGVSDIATVNVPHLLRNRFGIERIIAPIAGRDGDLAASLGPYRVILYPYVAGASGFQRLLSDQNWIDLGRTLQQMHAVQLTDETARLPPRETFSTYWREMLKGFQAQVESETFGNPEAEQLAIMMRSKRDLVTCIVERATVLAGVMRSRPTGHVLCHGDIHAGNVLIDDKDQLFVVDWDTLVLAPRERDLMFVGAGIGGVWNSEREEALFYRGYGQLKIDSEAIAYYRYERLVQDIAAFCEQLLASSDGGEDRAQSLIYFASQFEPGSVIDIALRSDPLS